MSQRLGDYFQLAGFKVVEVTTDHQIEFTVETTRRCFHEAEKVLGDPYATIEETSERPSKGFTLFVVIDEVTGNNVASFNITPENSEDLFFGRVAVLEPYRSKGIGAECVRATERWATQQGYKRVVLNYLSLDTTIEAYYEKLGYSQEGTPFTWRSLTIVPMNKVL